MPLSRIPPVLDRAFADAVARMVDADPPGLPVLDALAAFDAELAELVRTLREQLGDDGEVLSAVTDVCAVLSATHGDATRDASPGACRAAPRTSRAGGSPAAWPSRPPRPRAWPSRCPRRRRSRPRRPSAAPAERRAGRAARGGAIAPPPDLTSPRPPRMRSTGGERDVDGVTWTA
jgi:hypothetical protein